MNFRSRALLDLAYEIECTLRIPGACEGGTGEPAHANWAIWGKGGAMKAHDFAFASSCRACHVALDQGSKLSDAEREHYWLRGHVETMRQLWERGLIGVVGVTLAVFTPQPALIAEPFPFKPVRERRKNRKTTAAANQVPRPATGFVR